MAEPAIGVNMVTADDAFGTQKGIKSKAQARRQKTRALSEWKQKQMTPKKATSPNLVKVKYMYWYCKLL